MESKETKKIKLEMPKTYFKAKTNCEKSDVKNPNFKASDTYVTRVTYETETANNVTTTTRKEKRINVTRKVNETAKILKAETAQEKLEELKKILGE